MIIKAVFGILLTFVFVLLLWFWRAYPKEFRGLFGAFTGTIRKVSIALRDGFQLMRCWLYTVRWKIRKSFRTRFRQSILGVVTLGSAYLVVDAFRSVLNTLPKSILKDWFPNLVEPTFYLDISILSLAAIVLIHHAKELIVRLREVETPSGFTKLLEEVWPFIKKTNLSDDERILLFETVARNLVSMLETGKRKQEFVSLMLQKRSNAQRLFCTHIYPTGSPKVDSNEELSLERDSDGDPETVAGGCYLLAGKREEAASIYVPSIRHLGAINIRTLETLGLIYKPVTNEPGLSMVCVPVFSGGAVGGVLSVASSKRDAFEPIDFHICEFAASLLQDALLT
jgi:hypothetical protein